jgi:hypothetical protein
VQHRLRGGPYYRIRLRHDRQLETELAVCFEYGIPHSEFLNWIPADQAKAVAYFAHKNEKCGLCGTAEWEWDPEQGGSRYAYEPVEKMCPGCYAKHDQGTDRPGAFVTLEPSSSPTSIRRRVAQEAEFKARQRAMAKARTERLSTVEEEKVVVLGE